jgi:hypothetical protein
MKIERGKIQNGRLHPRKKRNETTRRAILQSRKTVNHKSKTLRDCVLRRIPQAWKPSRRPNGNGRTNSAERGYTKHLSRNTDGQMTKQLDLQIAT